MNPVSFGKYTPQYREDENIPCIECGSWKDFADIVETLNDDRDSCFVFRGQRQNDWKLTPGLARFMKSDVVEEYVADEQIRRFRKSIRGRVADHALMTEDDDSEINELWSIGQHYGLYTPLLDWTQSPYVALFFAFEGEVDSVQITDSWRVVYALNKKAIESLNVDSESAIQFIEPRKDDHGRLVSQAGLFTRSAYGKTLENALLESLNPLMGSLQAKEEALFVATFLVKILIKNESRREVLKYLRQMNIHFASLFPDLIGSAKDCNRQIEEMYAPPENLPAQPTVGQVAAQEIDISDNEEIDVRDIALDVQTAMVNVNSWSIASPEKLRSLLAELGSSRVNSDQLARDILRAIEPNTSQVDWNLHEASIARIRNITRAILRRNGYSEPSIDKIIGRFIIQGEAQE